MTRKQAAYNGLLFAVEVAAALLAVLALWRVL